MKNILLLILLATLIPKNSYAINLYGGLGYSYNILTAENDFWNGADGSDPFFTIGAQMNKFSLELTYRSIDLEKSHTTQNGTYDVVVTDDLLNLGLRLDLNRISHLNFGLVYHSVDVSYSTSSTSRLNTGSIVGSTLNAYLGGGIHGRIFLPNLKYTIDLNYFHRNTGFGIFSIETGIFYSFYSF